MKCMKIPFGDKIRLCEFISASLTSSLIPHIIFEQSLTTKQRFSEGTSTYYQAASCPPPPLKSSSGVLVPAGHGNHPGNLVVSHFSLCYPGICLQKKKTDSLCPLHGTPPDSIQTRGFPPLFCHRCHLRRH